MPFGAKMTSKQDRIFVSNWDLYRKQSDMTGMSSWWGAGLLEDPDRWYLPNLILRPARAREFHDSMRNIAVKQLKTGTARPSGRRPRAECIGPYGRNAQPQRTLWLPRLDDKCRVQPQAVARFRGPS